MNLVVGSTGRMGGEICHLLTAKGQPVRGMVRATSDPAKIDRLKAMGVQIVTGNLCDRASLDKACQGATTVITMVTCVFSYRPGENDIQHCDLEGTINLIEAARTAGAKYFVYVSFSGNIDLDSPLRNAKRTVEQYLKESGLSYTILRPSYYMESWLSPYVRFDPANGKVLIFGSGEKPISWISYKDVAKFAVESLNNPAAINTTLELGGPAALTPLQAVKVFEEVDGRSIEVTHISEADLKAAWQAGSDEISISRPALQLSYAQGDPIEMRETLKKFPMQLTTVQEYARQVLVPAQGV
jgi:uncharacterized protein YbjT (DUF2867 family)